MTKPISTAAGMELPYVIDTGLVWPQGKSKRKHPIDHIQIHHTVGVYGTPTKWASLQRSKIKKKGHKGVGYSYLITRDGDIYLGRGLEYSHGGVKDSLTTNEKGIGANQRSVAIALDGDMRKDDLPTFAQMRALVRLVQDILAYYGEAPALGHNEIPTYSNRKLTGKTYATACPCLDMPQLRAMVAGGALPTPEPEPEPEDAPDDDPTYPAKYQYIGDTYSNIRSGPGTKYSVIGKVSKGETCTVLDAQADAKYMWYEVQMPGVRGWCTANYLREVG